MNRVRLEPPPAGTKGISQPDVDDCLLLRLPPRVKPLGLLLEVTAVAAVRLAGGVAITLLIHSDQRSNVWSTHMSIEDCVYGAQSLAFFVLHRGRLSSGTQPSFPEAEQNLDAAHFLSVLIT